MPHTPVASDHCTYPHTAKTASMDYAEHPDTTACPWSRKHSPSGSTALAFGARPEGVLHFTSGPPRAARLGWALGWPVEQPAQCCRLNDHVVRIERVGARQHLARAAAGARLRA
eukprot:28089-Prymnesium_polylepis.1